MSNKKKKKIFEERVNNYLNKRGISGHVVADKFRKDFLNALGYLGLDEDMGWSTSGPWKRTLSLLEDDNLLLNNNIMTKNFRKKFDELIVPILLSDPIFPELWESSLRATGKGVGIGELALPLIISDYKFVTDGDGLINEKDRVEIKNGKGSSLKTLESDITQKGHIDKLVDKIFNGAAPGYKDKKMFNKHLIALDEDPSKYYEFFSQVYPGSDIKNLVESIARDYTDPIKFAMHMGEFALREYKRIDGWKNLVLIHEDENIIVNIYDITDIHELGLIFKPCLKRGKDTQALPDGYVNIKIGKI